MRVLLVSHHAPPHIGGVAAGFYIPALVRTPLLSYLFSHTCREIQLRKIDTGFVPQFMQYLNEIFGANIPPCSARKRAAAKPCDRGIEDAHSFLKTCTCVRQAGAGNDA